MQYTTHINVILLKLSSNCQEIKLSLCPISSLTCWNLVKNKVDRRVEDDEGVTETAEHPEPQRPENLVVIWICDARQLVVGLRDRGDELDEVAHDEEEDHGHGDDGQAPLAVAQSGLEVAAAAVLEYYDMTSYSFRIRRLFIIYLILFLLPV